MGYRVMCYKPTTTPASVRARERRARGYAGDVERYTNSRSRLVPRGSTTHRRGTARQSSPGRTCRAWCVPVPVHAARGRLAGAPIFAQYFRISGAYFPEIRYFRTNYNTLASKWEKPKFAWRRHYSLSVYLRGCYPAVTPRTLEHEVLLRSFAISPTTVPIILPSPPAPTHECMARGARANS